MNESLKSGSQEMNKATTPQPAMRGLRMTTLLIAFAAVQMRMTAPAAAYFGPVLKEESEVYNFNPDDPPMSVTWYRNPSEEVMRIFGRLFEILPRFHPSVMPVILEYKTEIDVAPAYVVKTKELYLYGLGPGSGVIVITYELLELVRNEHELALIIAHELAHVQLEHVKKVTSKSRRLYEREADIVGALYMQEAGFNCKEAEGVFRHSFEVDWARATTLFMPPEEETRDWVARLHEIRYEEGNRDAYPERLNVLRKVCK
ncbi:MAG: M48 family metalloprotease [Elusimicrobia bacterium]|nr:M48 family metalloprotease [Elusimicrobiota bacterium]